MKQKIDVLKDRIKHHEGLRLKPYKDSVGVLTIGYGHNLEQGITLASADFLFEEDFRSAVADARKLPEFDAVCTARQYVLIEMVFNMGLPTMVKFVNTRRAIREGRYGDAARGMLNSKWARQVGKRAELLAEIMETGIFK